MASVKQTRMFDHKEYTLDRIIKRSVSGPKYIEAAKIRVNELHKQGYFARYIMQLSGRNSIVMIFCRKRESKVNS